jgi:hypothetical protein
MTEEPHNSRLFKTFVNARGVIFALCLINAAAVGVMDFMNIRQWNLAHPTGSLVSHTYPVWMVEPFLLLGAAVGLLINRWWSVLLATLVTMRVIYLLVYLPLAAVDLALGIPILSLQAVQKLWVMVYEPHPRYLVATVLAIGMFAYGVFLSLRFVYSRAARPTHGG